MPLWRGCGVWIGLHEQREAIAVIAVGDPGLRAVDDIIVAVALGRRADRLQVGAAIWLGQGNAAAQVLPWQTAEDSAPSASSVPLRCTALAMMTCELTMPADRHPDGRNALDDLGVGRRRQAEPAVFRRDQAAEQTHRLHLLDDLRSDIRRVPRGRARKDSTSASRNLSTASRIIFSSLCRSAVTAMFMRCSLPVRPAVTEYVARADCLGPIEPENGSRGRVRPGRASACGWRCRDIWRRSRRSTAAGPRSRD